MGTRTNRGALQELVADLNPWWRDPDWAEIDPDLVAIRGAGLGYQTDALRAVHPGGLYVLRGPRRVGKTVATKQLISSLLGDGVPEGSIVRVAVDGWPLRDLQTVIQRLPLPILPPGVQRHWVIDEITGVEGDWASEVKWLRDNVAEFGAATVVVTGSDAAALTAAIGRWAGRRGAVTERDRTLLPMGFRTFVDLVAARHPTNVPRLPLADVHSSVGADAYGSLVAWMSDLARMWRLYLAHGGYPRSVVAAKQGKAIPDDFVDDIFDVIFRDAFADSRLSKTDASSLVERVMEGMGTPLNATSIADDIAAHPTTVTRHLTHLRNAYLAWVCPQRSDTGWTALPKAQPKVYAIDSIVARVSYLRNVARHDVDPTILSEMMLGMAIRRAAIASGREWDGDDLLFYHRTPTGKEIDFVSPLLGPNAVEGKFTDGRWRREAITVNASEWRGILATDSVLEVETGERQDKAWAVPAGLLAYLIDT